MNISDREQILGEKGNLCITIILPTNGYTIQRMNNQKRIEKTVLKVKEQLRAASWPKGKIQQVNERLDAILGTIDYLRLQDGLAIFVSPNISRLILLPFTVKEKIVVDNNFEVRDLFYYEQFLKPYFLLVLSNKRIRFFKGEGRDIKEVINNDFPRPYKDEYEYARPSLASSYISGLQQTEGDKSVTKEMREKAFLKQTDKVLNNYLKGNVPLVIAGTQEVLANYLEVTHHSELLAGKVEGNYDYDALHPLAEAVWAKMDAFFRTSENNILLEIREAIGRRMAVEGIREVWRAAKEGKGLTLVLEKDYKTEAYVDPEYDFKIHLKPPTDNLARLSDAVDELIEMVNRKNGNIVMVENGTMEDHGHIALLLRYPE